MGFDYKRVIFILLGFLIAEVLIGSFLQMLGIGGITGTILFYLLYSFVGVLLNYPSGYRISAFKQPEFYRDVAVLFFIFLILVLIRV